MKSMFWLSLPDDLQLFRLLIVFLCFPVFAAFQSFRGLGLHQ